MTSHLILTFMKQETRISHGLFHRPASGQVSHMSGLGLY